MIRVKIRANQIGDWVVALLPQEASSQLPSRSQVFVRGTLNGKEFWAVLEPDGRGGHWLHLDQRLQRLVNIAAGDEVHLAIEPSKEWPEPPEVPADFMAALDAHPVARALWDKVTPMARWEWLRWIGSTNVEATRQKHIEVSCSKLDRGMRRPCCFNRSMCTVPEVSKSGVLLEPVTC